MKKAPFNYAKALYHWAFIIATSFILMTSTYAEKENTTELSKTALYNILAGEFATFRGQYNQALDFYLQQARFYQSPYLAERATRLSLDQKRFKEMLEAAIIWQQTDNKNPLAYLFLSLAFAHNQDLEQAFTHMETTAKLNHSTDFTQLAHILNQQDNQNFFLQRLFILSNTHTNNYDIHLATAILSLATDNSQQALFYTNKAAQTAGNNEAVYDYAAKIYINQEKPERALAMYSQATDHYPQNIELRLQYAQLASRYNLKVASEQFELLLILSPDNPLILLNLGLIYLDQENIDQSKSIFERLLSLSKHNALAHYYLGGIANLNNNENEALQHFLAINDGHQTARAREQIASIYIKQQRYDEAEEIIDSELNQPKNALHIESLNILKAQLLQQQGHTALAYEHLSQQLSNSPDSIDIRYNRAMLAELQNNLRQMESDLRHIIHIHPDSILALNALGYTLANKTNRLDEAYRLIKQAHQLSPQDPAILDSLGWVLYRMGQWQEALKYLQQAMQQFPDAEVAAHLGEVLWMTGKKEDAKVVLKDALRQTPDHTELNETIKRLNISL